MTVFKRLFAAMLCFSCFCSTTVFTESDSDYSQMLSDAVLNCGNALRLKRVLERAKNGEPITIAAIGGSITEGAGASAYKNCYANLVGEGLKQRCGSNVHMINAGVGGTPSTFGWIRYENDVLKRVPAEDADGLPDIVIIEFAVNDWNEPTRHRCYESMVKSILQSRNDPAVILLFSVFKNGWNLQDELKKVGETYDLMMISIRDAAYPRMDRLWTKDEWFFDEYHPTDLGHRVMADCILAAIDCAAEQKGAEKEFDLNVSPAYGLDYMDLRRIFAGRELPEGVTLEVGGFRGDDRSSYTNLPVGRVCGQNFAHMGSMTNDPLILTAAFSKLLIGWRTAAGFGTAKVYIDGKLVQTLAVPDGSWGQTEVSLILNAPEKEEHTVEILMAENSEKKPFTITCIAID